MRLSRPLSATVLVAALIAAALGLQRALQLDRYREPIAALLAQWTGGAVAIDHLDWGLDDGLWLKVEGLKIEGAHLPPGDLALDGAYARLALRPLLRRTLRIEALQLQRPTIRYRLAAPTPATVDAAAAGDSQPPAFDIGLRSLRISDGALTLVDGRRTAAAVTTLLEHVELRVDDLAAGETARLAATAVANGAGRIDLRGSFAGLQRHFAIARPWLALQAELNDLPVDGLDVHVGDPALAQALAGSLSAQASYEGNFSDAGTLLARLDMAGLRYLDAQAPPGGSLELTLDARLEGPHLLPRLALRSGGITLDASGRVANWQSTPALTDGTATGVLPLHELQALIPWSALGASAPYLRDLVAGGGELRLERALLAELPLEPPPDWRVLIPQLAARVSIDGLSIQTKAELPRLEDLSGAVELDRGALTAHDIQGRLGPLRLPPLQLEVTQLTAAPHLQATLRGPLVLAASRDRQVAALLRRAGLAHLQVDGALDLSGEIALARPEQWRASGELRLRGLQLTTLAGERLEGSGSLRLRRRQWLDLLIPGFEGRLDGARFAVSGAVYSADTSARLADIDLEVREFELASLARRIPQLAPYRLTGRLSSQLDVYYQQDAPARSGAQGTLALHDLELHIPAADLNVAGLQARLAIERQRLVLQGLTAQLNDQPVTAEGSLQNFTAPRLVLQLSSSMLDLDRLLPASAPAAPAAASAVATPPGRRPRALPAWARQGSASIDVAITRGAFQRVPFRDFSLQARYDKTQLRRLDAAVRLPQGNVQAQGWADLSRLDAIPFGLRHAISGIELAELTRLLGGGVERASGTLDSTGEITANTADLKQTLQGHVTAMAGPGHIPNRSAFARTLFSILAIINVQGILKGEISSGLTSAGLLYDELLVDTTLTPGLAQFDRMELLTPAFSTRAVGDIDLRNETLSFDAAIAVLGTLDKILGMVPLVGSAVAQITKVYLNISGPTHQPLVKVQPGKGLRGGVDEILALPLRMVPSEAAKR